MKIGMQTWGSHGDVRPFLALAEGLQAAGHEVHLVLTCVDSAAYASHVSRHGVRITVLASPVLTPEQVETFGATAYRIRDPMKQMAAILRMCFDPVEEQMFEAAQDLCKDADLLIGHFMMYPLQFAAEQAGRPWVNVVLSHVTIPTEFDYPLGAPFLGKAGHRFLWWLTRVLIHRALQRAPNRLRRRLGMPPIEDVLQDIWLSPWLTLAAVSAQLCRPQPDWPAPVRLCGFLDMSSLDIEGVVSGEVDVFLAAGAAPVYMTLGSWMPRGHAEQAATLRLLSQAARTAGCRAIIQSHAAAACGFTSDEQLLYVSAAPHQAIFPRCCALVHHGGAGTTQSATLAGKPSIVVAHIGEQEYWGTELRRRGIAGKTLWRRRVTAGALAKRIRDVLAAPGMAVKAEAMGAAMRREDGVAEAVRLITALGGRARFSRLGPKPGYQY
jgi:sterol 3beta-glucosyltransferase